MEYGLELLRDMEDEEFEDWLFLNLYSQKRSSIPEKELLIIYDLLEKEYHLYRRFQNIIIDKLKEFHGENQQIQKGAETSKD